LNSGVVQVMKESMQAEMARMEDDHRTRAAAHQARRRPSARPAALLQQDLRALRLHLRWPLLRNGKIIL
jgi:hypothetical protein